MTARRRDQLSKQATACILEEQVFVLIAGFASSRQTPL